MKKLTQCWMKCSGQRKMRKPLEVSVGRQHIWEFRERAGMSGKPCVNVINRREGREFRTFHPDMPHGLLRKVVPDSKKLYRCKVRVGSTRVTPSERHCTGKRYNWIKWRKSPPMAHTAAFSGAFGRYSRKEDWRLISGTVAAFLWRRAGRSAAWQQRSGHGVQTQRSKHYRCYKFRYSDKSAKVLLYFRLWSSYDRTICFRRNISKWKRRETLQHRICFMKIIALSRIESCEKKG